MTQDERELIVAAEALTKGDKITWQERHRGVYHSDQSGFALTLVTGQGATDLSLRVVGEHGLPICNTTDDLTGLHQAFRDQVVRKNAIELKAILQSLKSVKEHT